ncbi:MAG: hypothetical protein GY847_34290 [Proteobacteria bacterium]|nr:hypothetical protein [Pseudomonadota bacterium]
MKGLFQITILLLTMAELVRSTLGYAADADAPKTVVNPSLAAVVPAEGFFDSTTLHGITEEARGSLDELDYELVNRQAVQTAMVNAGIAARPRPGYTDRELISLGTATGAGLVVYARIIGKSGKKARIRVKIARVRKARIWTCTRRLETDESELSLPEAAKQGFSYCVEQLLARTFKRDEEREQGEVFFEETREKIEWPKDWYIGVMGTVIPRAKQKIRFYQYQEGGKVGKSSTYIIYDESGGFGLFFEKRMRSWAAIGLQFDYYMLLKRSMKRKEAVKDDYFRMINFSGTLRLFYPGKWFEPYLKLELGLLVGSTSWLNISKYAYVESGAGAVYQFRLGTMVTFPYCGVFFDAGLFAAPWFPGIAQSDYVIDAITGLETGLTLNFGLFTTF